MKQKTKKAANKRFLFSKKGKAKRKPVGQGHFNARATGDQTRKKHRTATISPADEGRITQLIPYK